MLPLLLRERCRRLAVECDALVVLAMLCIATKPPESHSGTPQPTSKAEHVRAGGATRVQGEAPWRGAGAEPLRKERWGKAGRNGSFGGSGCMMEQGEPMLLVKPDE